MVTTHGGQNGRFPPCHRGYGIGIEAAMRLSAEPLSASAARTFVARTLDAWGRPEVAETATLLTSELVGNVVRHGHTDMLLALRLRDHCVEVEVADRSPEPVTLRDTPVDAVSGR